MHPPRAEGHSLVPSGPGGEDLRLWAEPAAGRTNEGTQKREDVERQGANMEWPTAAVLIALIVALMVIVSTWLASRSSSR